MFWQTTRYLIALNQPKIMGIVNVTPDSFSDGGEHSSVGAALRQCERLIRDGADILDIGGESTRPGSLPVSVIDEMERVIPVVREALKLGVPVSVDTSKPEVMQAVLDLGVDIVNDIWALRNPGAAEVVSQHPSCGVCLMHMHRDPNTMQVLPMAGDAVPQVRVFLLHAARRLQGLGVTSRRIVLDPGIGFGKTVAQNFSLLARQAELQGDGYPLLVGWSRKSSLGTVSAVDGTTPVAGKRVGASIAAALLAVQRGAAIVRVHDVLETVQALQVWKSLQANQQECQPE